MHVKSKKEKKMKSFLSLILNFFMVFNQLDLRLTPY